MFLQKVRNKQKNVEKNRFCWSIEGQWQKWQDPDPLVRVTDPRIRIYTKMSRIHNSAAHNFVSVYFLFLSRSFVLSSDK